jgi:hypothetical protein
VLAGDVKSIFIYYRSALLRSDVWGGVDDLGINSLQVQQYIWAMQKWCYLSKKNRWGACYCAATCADVRQSARVLWTRKNFAKFKWKPQAQHEQALPNRFQFATDIQQSWTNETESGCCCGSFIWRCSAASAGKFAHFCRSFSPVCLQRTQQLASAFWFCPTHCRVCIKNLVFSNSNCCTRFAPMHLPLNMNTSNTGLLHGAAGAVDPKWKFYLLEPSENLLLLGSEPKA